MLNCEILRFGRLLGFPLAQLCEAVCHQTTFEEAMRLRRINHDNIVHVFCLVSESRKISGYCMELLAESLQKASDQGCLCRHRLATAFAQTCEAGTVCVKEAQTPIRYGSI